MTYDPLSYGEIKLRDRAAKPGETADDILFEDAGPGYAPDAASASDWDELAADADPMAPGGGAFGVSQFGADVLGETEPEPAAAPTPVPAAPRPPRPQQPAARPPGLRSPTPARAATKSTPRERLPARSRRPVQRQARVMGALVPTVIVACGGSAAAWFYMMEENVVMAGIVGAICLVGAALGRVMFR